MRILWVGHNLAYPPVRGVLLRNFNLLRELAKEYDVRVLAFDQPATRPPDVSAEDCVAALQKFCTHVEYVPLKGGGANLYSYCLGAYGLMSHNAYDFNWLRSDRMARRLQRALEHVRFDTVHFDTLGLAQYRRLVGSSATVLNHHNIESSMMDHRATNETHALRRKYWQLEAAKLRRAERSYCPHFDLNIVVSPEDGESLASIAPGLETRVVPNGVDTEYFTPRPDPGGNTLLFCGGLDWYPNGEAMAYFFEAIWPRLTSRLPEVRIFVVGRRPPKWLQQLGHSDQRVHVTGFVGDVRPYFRNATAYICPIRVGGGTRLKVLDALAMGMPMVATPFACSGLELENEQHILMAETPEAFVNQTLRVLADQPLRGKLTSQGRDLVCQRYSWSIIGNSLRLAYKEASVLASPKFPFISD
jgi:glycosyltransferase involved in cell wall biosynthesis